MKINKTIFKPFLFLDEQIGEPFWAWENLQFNNSIGRNCYDIGEIPNLHKDFISYHCGQNTDTGFYGIINSNYDLILPFEYSKIEPKNPYFYQNYIKKDTYYFYIWKDKNVGLVKVENDQLVELIKPIHKKIEQCEKINFYECKTSNYSNLYNLLTEKFLFKENQYRKISDTSFSISMFNLYIDKKCVLYDFEKNEIVISDLQDVYFVNNLGSYSRRTGLKIYGLNSDVLIQYNIVDLKKEKLDIDSFEMKLHKINCIKQSGISRNYQKVIIEKYFK